MTNLEVLRQGLKEFIDKATDEELFNILSHSSYCDICDCCAMRDLCDKDCFTWFVIWGDQEHKKIDKNQKIS